MVFYPVNPTQSNHLSKAHPQIPQLAQALSLHPNPPTISIYLLILNIRTLVFKHGYEFGDLNPVQTTTAVTSQGCHKQQMD